MRLPVYLQLALALSVTALSTHQEQVALPRAESVTSFMEEGTEITVRRQTPPANPDDLDADTVLISVRGTIEQIMASVPAEDSSALLSALEYQFGEVDLVNDLNYVYTWDSDENDWIRICIDQNTFSIRASTLANPIDVRVVVTIRI